MVAFSQNNYQSALDYFSRAVTTHPYCDPSIRTAIACCCFKLQQYDRARLALHRANTLDPSDVNQLVLQSLLELVEAKKDRTNRIALRQKAYEYLYLGSKLDPNHPSILILLANHDFHSWRSITLEPNGYLLSNDKILVPFKGYNEVFEEGNQIKLKSFDEGSYGNEKITNHVIVGRKEGVWEDYELLFPSLASFEEQAGQDITSRNQRKYYEITITPILSSLASFPYKITEIEVKNLKAVVSNATKALFSTNLPSVKAECYYILGKVYHIHQNLQQAFEYYGKSLSLAGDMAPAAFGAAQIYFARQDYPNSLKLFSDILQGNADDKDTLSYVKLLKGILHDEITPIEKLREIAPGKRVFLSNVF
jgi:tetratricopeptide (TPR) repeat protein